MKFTTKQKLLIIVIIAVIAIVAILISIRKISVENQSKSNLPEDVTSKGYLMEKTGEIDITSGTVGAKVTATSLENSFIATQSLPAQIKVPAGKYSIQVFANGFDNFEKDIEISADQTVKIDATLIKLENDISEGAPI